MRDDRTWVSIPMSMDMKERIEKASARNDMAKSVYLRMAIRTYMERASEWSLPGPKTGSRRSKQASSEEGR